MHLNQVSNWEHGRQVPALANQPRFAEAVGLVPEMLLARSTSRDTAKIRIIAGYRFKASEVERMLADMTEMMERRHGRG